VVGQSKQNCLQRPPEPGYKSAFLKSDVKLFQTLMAAADKVLFPKLLDVRWTVSVLVSAERSCLAQASVTSWQSSARYPGQGPIDERRYLEHNALSDRLPIGADFSFWVPGHNLRDYIRVTFTIGRKMCLRPLNITEVPGQMTRCPCGFGAYAATSEADEALVRYGQT